MGLLVTALMKESYFKYLEPVSCKRSPISQTNFMVESFFDFSYNKPALGQGGLNHRVVLSLD